MIDNNIEDIARETIEILKHFDKNIIEKIPKSVINNLEEVSKNSKKRIDINMEIPLKEQNISEESKDLISVIYYKYIANEQNKKQVFEAWKNK